MAKKGQTATVIIKAAAIPKASYQWFKNGKVIKGAVNPVLKIDKVKLTDAGKYFISIKNDAGSIRSKEATFILIN